MTTAAAGEDSVASGAVGQQPNETDSSRTPKPGGLNTALH